jgi:hypothetical protein
VNLRALCGRHVPDLLLEKGWGVAMTEAEWNGCTDPQQMLVFLRSRGPWSDRKGRLFAAACCRRSWAVNRNDSRRAVAVAEQYADGQVPRKSLVAIFAYAEANGLPGSAQATVDPEADQAARNTALLAAREAAVKAGFPAHFQETLAVENAAQASLLRDLFHPFPPLPPIARSLLDWDNGTLVRLAAAIYQERRWGDLPIVADALEEAGCTDAGLLGHLRGPGPHARGCYALDLVLGKT